MPYIFLQESLFIWGVSVLIVVLLALRWIVWRKRARLIEKENSAEDT